MTKKFFKSHVFLIIVFLLLCPLTVGAISSTSYQIDPSGTDTLHQNTTSSSYQLEGSLEPVTGSKSSTSYGIEFGSSFAGYCGDGFIDPSEDCDGAALNSQTCVTLGHLSGTLTCSTACAFVTTACSDTPAGGGDSQVILPPGSPSFDSTLLSKQYTYLSSLLFFGVKQSDASVLVNGSSEGVSYLTDYRWQKTISLQLGNNSVAIQAQNGNGVSGIETLTMLRRKAGDVNYDNAVNDYDFSLLANHWNANYPLADFNEDGTVNDYDLSIMGGFWTK